MMDELTAREREIVSGYRRGLTAEEIGVNRRHIYKVLEKAGIKPNRREVGNRYIQPAQCPHRAGRSRPSYKEWRAKLQALRRGERIVYHQDGEARDSGIFAAVWDEYAQERPAVIPLQRRAQGGRLVHIAQRR